MVKGNNQDRDGYSQAVSSAALIKHHSQNKNTSSQNFKGKKYRDIFIEKLKRTLSTKQPYEPITPSQWNYKYIKKIQGIQFSFLSINLFVIFSNIVGIFLSFYATLFGFIPHYSRTDGNGLTSVLVRSLCLAFTIVFFVIKCIARFGFGDKSKYVHEIMLAYAKTFRLFLDLVSISFQIAILISPQQVWIARMAFIPFTLRLNLSIADTYGLQISLFQTELALLSIKIIKILLSNLLFGHFMATVLLMMSNFNAQDNWLIKAGIADQTWPVIYINAYYWGCTIMMTVGFGDLLPSTTLQKLFTSLLEILSCALLGYNISAIGSLLSEINLYRENVNRRKAIFRRMIRYDNGRKLFISQQLEIKIVHFIEKSNIGRSNVHFLERDEIIKQLPDYLRKAYFNELNPKIFPKVRFFKNLRPDTLQKISQKLTRRCFFPQQRIIQNPYDQIIIMKKGQIGLAAKLGGSKLNGVVLDTFKAQGQIYDLHLITIYPFNLLKGNNYDLIALSNVLALSIQFQQFQQTLKQNQVDFQYYFSEVHSHSIDSNKYNFMRCERCQTKHSVFDCPRLTYKPLRSIITARYINEGGIQQQRATSYKRKRDKSFRASTRITAKQTKQAIVKFATNYHQMIQYLEPFNLDYQQISTPNYNYRANSLKVKDNNSILDEQQSISQLISANQQKLKLKIGEQRLKIIIQEVLQKYQNKYEDGLWTIQSDAAYNYKFYFPNFNPWRVRKLQWNQTPQQLQIKKNNKYKKLFKRPSARSLLSLTEI